MADFLDTTFIVSYARECPPESYKLLNNKKRIQSSAYEGGERVLQAGDASVKLVDAVTNFYLVAEKPITITLSDGTSFDKMDQFCYSGENPISVSVTNAGNLPVKMTYAGGLRVI